MGDDSKYEAVCSRDARFDGEFFFAVATTGIYCRPSCPATTPKRRNVRFYATAAAAQGSGFRACRRCRPDAVPGSAEWNARADVVGRAMRLIADGVVDREGVAGLAERLGYSARQVQRQLSAELGAGPIALARAQRAHTARTLLQTTAMPITDIAFAAGFSSVRQFNDTVRDIYAVTPSELRAAAPGSTARFGSIAPASTAPGIALRLPFRGPYDAAAVFDYLEARAVTGVEEITGARGNRHYRRTLRLPHGLGVADVDEALGDSWMACHLCLEDLRDLTTATHRMRRMFDLDADPRAVAEHLSGDPALAPLVAARPGLRAPGTADPHELAIRVVSGGRAAATSLVQRYGTSLTVPRGTITHVFPSAAELADAPMTELCAERRRATRAVARALMDGTVRLDPGADRNATEAALACLPGVTAEMARYIRMRGLGDPDVLSTCDIVDQEAPERWDTAAWRPWRTYGVHHLAATRPAHVPVPRCATPTEI
ncbi:DNA-3-methyladenine glycosylase 2 family protein [Rhodococcus sp. ABRD24]|nr:DNA-3-methyladenine glycosylase 2 family protein [Rhodococcus sp. ABRD24]